MESIERELIDGVYVPLATFFDPESEDLDLKTTGDHAVRIADGGVAGVAVQGSNGEAVHLTHSERNQVTFAVRGALDKAGYTHMPIIAGCGAQSTRETILLCQEAHDNGADCALVLPPSYYSGLFSPSSASLIEFFTKVADASPIPVLIYNYPGAVSGLDLNSDVIIQLSKHDNIVGVKLTCGNTGKLNRIVSATKTEPTPESSAFSPKPRFLVLGGSADFTLPSMIGGGHGILAGLANIAPRACVKTVSLYQENKLQEAQAMQEILARGDWEVIQTGVVGTKSVLQSYLGYGGFGRAPLPRPSKEASLRWKSNFAELMELEQKLEGEKSLG